MAKYRIKMNYVQKFKWNTCPSKRGIASELYLDDSMGEEFERVIIRAYNIKIKRCKRREKYEDRMFLIKASFNCPEEHLEEYKEFIIKYLDHEFCNIEIKEIKKPYIKK